MTEEHSPAYPDSAPRSQTPRTLIVSQRNLGKVLPFRCPHFEFEDIVAEIDSVDMLAPRMDIATRRHGIAKKLAYHTPISLNPGIRPERIRAGYDLFLAICGNPSDLLRINAAGDWRSACRKAVCLIDEVWLKEIKDYRNFLQMLKRFDLVVLYYSNSVAAINDLLQEEKCIFAPPGVDTIRFCPYPNPPLRSIDVYSIGRRSAVTHQALLKLAVTGPLFYLYDSTSADQVLDATEHRILVAKLSMRSRYFIVNPGLIDRPDIRGDQIEIGNRYFEGAASGNILLGERPRNGEFEKLFDWADALIEMPYNSPEIGKILRDLDAQPERQLAARKMNMSQALLRHDWLYRWETILNALGVEPLPGLRSRKEKLRRLADLVMQSETDPESERRSANRVGVH
jgi:hypothetical protein